MTTLLFDAYAVSSAPTTHDTGVSIDSLGPGFGANHIRWQADTVGGFRGWRFVVSVGGSSNLFSVPGGFDRRVVMSIVLDGVANEVYGLYDFGGGFVQTPHFAVTDAQLADLNAVLLYVAEIMI
jgi:hypothetical protein